MTIIKAAAVQMSPVLYSREGTVDKVVRKIIELGRQGVQFATFPETVVPYYPYFSFVQPPYEMAAEHLRLLEQAVTVPSAATLAIGEACKQAGMVVSIGVNERDGGTLYNTQLLFDADGTPDPAPPQDLPDLPRTHDLGPGRRLGAASRRQRGRAHRLAGVLGALQPAGPLRPDGRRRADPLGDVSRLVRGRPFRRADQVNIRQHALESGCFVVNATAWLDADQQAQIMKDTGCADRPDLRRLLYRDRLAGRRIAGRAPAFR